MSGEAIYSALFDAAPSLQSLFKTPRRGFEEHVRAEKGRNLELWHWQLIGQTWAKDTWPFIHIRKTNCSQLVQTRSVMAMRFMNGLTGIMNALSTPPALKVMVETLGFQHLDLAAWRFSMRILFWSIFKQSCWTCCLNLRSKLGVLLQKKCGYQAALRMWQCHGWRFFAMPLSISLIWNWAQGQWKKGSNLSNGFVAQDERQWCFSLKCVPITSHLSTVSFSYSRGVDVLPFSQLWCLWVQYGPFNGDL